MGIELGITNQQPAINRNKVFMTRLEIVQALNDDDTVPPQYCVQIDYRCYGVDAQNKRHFVTETYEVLVPDFIQRAMSEATKGDTSMIQALQAIEGAVAAIIADDLNTTATII